MRMWGAARWSDRLMRHGLVCVGCVVVCMGHIYACTSILPLVPIAPLLPVSVVPLPVICIL